MLDYKGYIDTIKLRAKVRLTKGGGALFSRATKLNNKKPDTWSYTYPLENTTYRHGYTKIPELVLSQDYNGSIKFYTHKDFTAEYGYHIYTQVPGWLYYLDTNKALTKTSKQLKAISGTAIYLDINIPSISGLFADTKFQDYIVGHYNGEPYSQVIWNYINHRHNLEAYGIRAYDVDAPLEPNDMNLMQVDIATNIRGRLVKDVMELVSVSGYYARKSMRIWNNTTADDKEGYTTYQSPNGIEFRRGKKSSEIYKFYDKELQVAQQYYDAIYTADSFTKNRAQKILQSTAEGDRTMLRYEVSLRRIASRKSAIERKYNTSGEHRNIYFTDILDNTIYSRVPGRILKDGLFNIFGSEIEKDITLLLGDTEMTDTDILQDNGTKGLKYMGIKYLLDKGMTNDQLWPYLYKTAGLNYEVVRRLRNELRENNILNNMNDSHTRTLDTLRGVYKDLK